MVKSGLRVAFRYRDFEPGSMMFFWMATGMSALL
jgi:hypothetical protein